MDDWLHVFGFDLVILIMTVKPGIGLGEKEKRKRIVKLIVHSPVGKLV